MRAVQSFLLASSSVLLCASATAGQRTVIPVSIFSTTAVVTANGSVSTAYNSADTQQMIGCSVSASAGGAPNAICEAVTAGGLYARCSSSDPAIVQAAAAVGGESVISFHYSATAPSPAPCIDLTVSNYSYSGPKL